MSDDLQFAALHSDDALLDALGARTPGASLGVAGGVDASASADLAARLLGAWAHEIDTRPGPLTDLLTQGAPAHARGDRPLSAVDDAKVAPLAARRRRRAMPRIAAAATAGVLVIGLGGVAAATGGAPLESLRRAVGAAPEATDSSPTAARALSFLASANKALDARNLSLAAVNFGRAQDLYFQIQDTSSLESLRTKIAAFRARWDAVAAQLAGAIAKGENPASESPMPILPGLREPNSPESASAPLLEPNYQLPGPDAKEQAVPEVGLEDPSDRVKLPDEGLEDEKGDRLEGAKERLRDAKDRIKDRAAEKLKPENRAPAPSKPLPGDLPGPSGGPVDGLGGPEGLFGR